jgi:hypothetical protein
MVKEFREEDVRRADIGTFTAHKNTRAEIKDLQFDDAEPLKANRNFADRLTSNDMRVVRAEAIAMHDLVGTFVSEMGAGRDLTEDQIKEAAADTMHLLCGYVEDGKEVKRGLIWQIATSHVAQQAGDPLRHETLKALRILAIRIDKQEVALGRPLADREVAELADDIRDTWPIPRHRPVIGFHLEEPDKRVADMDMEGLRELENLGDFNGDHAAIVTSWETAEQQRIHIRADEIESAAKIRATAVEKLQRQYTQFAGAYSLPLPVRGAVTPDEAETHTARTRGKIVRFAEAYVDGDRTPAHTESLFAPFGVLNAVERTQLAQAFSDAPAHADKLWVSALATARTKAEKVAAPRPNPRMPGRVGRPPMVAAVATSDPWASFASQMAQQSAR